MVVLYGLLAVASGVGYCFAPPTSQLRKQINAWWLIFPFVSLSMLVHPLGPPALSLLIVVLAIRELSLHHPVPVWRFQLVCGVIMVLQVALSTYNMSMASTVMALLLLVQFVHFSVRRGAAQILVMLFLFLCLGLSFLPRLLQLTNSAPTNLAWFFYLFTLTAINDIAQFICGKSFGKHKIATRISPQKTWQGLAGGVATSLLASVAIGSYLQLASVPQLLLLAVVLAPMGFLGDLIFSAAKRHLGIKDFSQLIPGHGGILDRVDSLVLTAPVLYFGLTW